VTNVNPVKLDGQTAMVPQNEALATGFYFSLQSAVSADGKFVNLNLKANLTSLASAVVPLFPVVTPIFPVVEGGFQGPPVNFTQFIQQPKFNTLALDRMLKIPDGGTVLLGGWKRATEGRNEFGPPVLSKIPYVNRLFKNVGYAKEPENILLMVTPRIITDGEKESTKAAAVRLTAKARAAAPDATEGASLTAVLAKYQRA